MHAHSSLKLSLSTTMHCTCRAAVRGRPVFHTPKHASDLVTIPVPFFFAISYVLMHSTSVVLITRALRNSLCKLLAGLPQGRLYSFTKHKLLVQCTAPAQMFIRILCPDSVQSNLSGLACQAARFTAVEDQIVLLESRGALCYSATLYLRTLYRLPFCWCTLSCN